MISRLVVSLRKAADTSIIRVWNGDHFTSVETGEHEMMDLVDPVFSPLSFKSPFSYRGQTQSSYPDPPGCRSEA